MSVLKFNFGIYIFWGLGTDSVPQQFLPAVNRQRDASRGLVRLPCQQKMDIDYDTLVRFWASMIFL
jgi:hypothetical protein